MTGGNGGSQQHGECSLERYAAAIKIGFTRDDNKPKYLDYIELSCGVLSGYGGDTKVCLETGDKCWDRHPDPGRYNGFGLSFQSRCPPGEMIAGLIGRSGSAIDAVGIICRPRPSASARADTAFRSWLATNGISNASLVVMQRGGVVGSFGYGARTATQAVEVASLSKAITGVCLTALVDAGRLAYSDTIGNRLDVFLKASPPRDPRVLSITIEQLLRHRSGIDTDPTQSEHFDNNDGSDRVIIRRALLSDLAPAPVKYFYNNVNYALLGLVIQVVTGQSYESYCHTMLAGRGAPNAHIGDGVRAMGAFGGWAISAVEYANFGRAFDQSQRLLSPPSFAFIDGGAYAFGEGVTRTANGRNFQHFGDWRADWTTPGQMGAYFALSDNGISIVATYDRHVEDPARNALDAALKQAVH
jgi:CubicO group peptidase (beta-lactamase class C family)